MPTLDLGALTRALEIRDLTDPHQGSHALQTLVDDVVAALARAWRCEVVVRRSAPVVPIADNYDALGYARDAAARDGRYARYVDDETMLRSHTSAMIPPLLRELAGRAPLDALLACPGIVYRRDCIDRMHTGEPHQIDLWRVRHGSALGAGELREMIACVVGALLPGRAWTIHPAVHPYTRDGLQVDVVIGSQTVEIGECGLAAPEVLARAGLSACTGLAMGLGLDRLLMLRKGIDDIRLLRSDDPRVARQMLDLGSYRAVSAQPRVVRDLSVAVDESDAAEDLGDRVRGALGDEATWVESVEVLSETPRGGLPEAAIARLGLEGGQKNLLVRVVLRHPTRSLTHPEANVLRDRVYGAIHRGSVHVLAASAATKTNGGPSGHGHLAG